MGLISLRITSPVGSCAVEPLGEAALRFKSLCLGRNLAVQQRYCHADKDQRSIRVEMKKILDANDAALRLYGYNRDELFGLYLLALSAEPEKSAAHFASLTDEEPMAVSPGPAERLQKKKDGSIFTAEISAGNYLFEGRKMVCAIMRDIRERKKAEQASQTAHAELENRVRNGPSNC